MPLFRLTYRAGMLALLAIYYGLPPSLKFLFYKSLKNKPSHSEFLGKFIVKFCETSGGAFLKFGQILSTRYDLFSEITIAYLQKLQDDVNPLNASKIVKVIETNFSKKLENLFDDFDLKPIASASIAQVHRARLKNHNGKVAVKIIRPGIKRQYQDDLRLASFVVRLMKTISLFNNIPVEESFHQIADCLLQQTDFLREAENNRKFQVIFNSSARVKFPRLIEEFCNDEIIVMEYFDGLVKITESVMSRGERETLTIQCLKALYRMIFVEGFIHCDLHPSNFFQYKECLVVVDTGFVIELNRTAQTAFRDFFRSIAFNDPSTCAGIIIRTALKRPEKFDSSNFEKEISGVLSKVSKMQAKSFQISGFVLELFSIQRKYELYSTPDFTLPILSLLVLEGTIKKYHPDLNFQEVAVPFLRTSVIESIINNFQPSNWQKAIK